MMSLFCDYKAILVYSYFDLLVGRYGWSKLKCLTNGSGKDGNEKHGL